MDLWTELLGLLSQIVTPLWGTLLQYIPLLFFGLIAFVLLTTVRGWRRNAARNRSRVPAPLRSGATPDGVHMPAPSLWPLVGSAGLFFAFLSLVLGLNPVLLAIAVVLAVAAAIGWLRDAGKEYAETEAGGHDLHVAPHVDGLEPLPERIPDGVHIPPPSPWPFLGPLGLLFVFLGLALGPILIVGGLLMGLIAAIGWLRDAGREYRDVEDGGHHEPERDPRKIWPSALVPVYATIAIAAILLTAAPTLLTYLPQTTETAAETGPEVTTTPYVSAVSVMSFEQSAIAVPADTAFTLTFENKQDGVPHNVAIYADATMSALAYNGELITGPATAEYAVPALAAGEYPFICVVHPVMAGTLYVR